MKKYSFYVVLLWTCFELYSQTDFREIDTIAPNIEYTSKESLAFDITENCVSDKDRVRALFVWITNNIDYDYELYHNPVLQELLYTSEDKVIERTLETKKAICSGYSLLFKKLCDDIRIECEIVNGYSRQYLDAFIEKEIVDHAWNTVKIDGRWYLIDTTWAAKNDAENIDDFWFLTDPGFFIYSHYPENEKWTLLEYPFSKAEFYKLPVITNRTFFEDNIKIVSPETETIKIEENGTVLIRIKTDNPNRPIDVIGFPFETYASKKGLEPPSSNDEYLKMTKEEQDKYTLVIPSVEIVDKEILNNTVNIEIRVESENIEHFDIIIDGNSVATFNLARNR